MTNVPNQILDKLIDGANIWIFATEEEVPDGFGQDMQDLFLIDMEKDILSKVYYQVDIECGRGTDGILVCVPKEITEADVKRILTDYIKEKNMSKAYIVLMIPNPDCTPYYKSYVYDNGTNEDLWEPYYDALCNDIVYVEDGVLNLYFDYAETGLKYNVML